MFSRWSSKLYTFRPLQTVSVSVWKSRPSHDHWSAERRRTITLCPLRSCAENSLLGVTFKRDIYSPPPAISEPRQRLQDTGHDLESPVSWSIRPHDDLDLPTVTKTTWGDRNVCRFKIGIWSIRFSSSKSVKQLPSLYKMLLVGFSSSIPDVRRMCWAESKWMHLSF